MLVKTLVATLFVIGVALAEQTPVFLWGANSPSKPSLQTVPQETFSELVGKLLEDHMVVAFQEDGLTPSDFLCSNAETSLSCYAYLQNVQNKNYYASVENPATAIRTAAEVREFNTVAEDGQLETPVECAKGKAIFVNFEQTSQLRSEQLAQHDAAIASIAKSMSCPTVFLYMPSASTAAKNRQRRSVLTAAPNGGYIYRQGAQFLMFYQNFYYVDASGQKEVIFTDAMTVTNSTSNANQFSVSLTSTDAKVLSFDITYSIDGYYTMSNVQYDSQGFYSSSVTAPIRFSYYCGNLTLAGVPPGTVQNPATVPSPNSLLWNSLQIQAPFGATSNATFVFGDPWHCVGFFTPGILSGLFVVILLLSIIFIGICWMMDINTMDRFDDPKGKTITINATD